MTDWRRREAYGSRCLPLTSPSITVVAIGVDAPGHLLTALQNRDSNLSLTNACVALVVVPVLSVSLLHVFPPRFPLNTHNATRTLCIRLITASAGVSGVLLYSLLFQALQWWIFCWKCLRTTKNACTDVTTCRGFHTDDGCCGMTVVRTDIFWCTRSVNNPWRFSS